MNFFKNMTFARAMILVCLASSGTLGYFVWKRQARIEDRNLSLQDGGRIELLVQDIQKASKQYSLLYERAEDEDLKGKEKPLTYINSIAACR